MAHLFISYSTDVDQNDIDLNTATNMPAKFQDMSPEILKQLWPPLMSLIKATNGLFNELLIVTSECTGECSQTKNIKKYIW